MNKTVLYIVGIVLVVVGLLGFIGDPVLGIFTASLIGNIINVVLGLAIVYAAAKGGSTGELFVKISAVVYAIIAILGLVLPGESILGIIDTNLSTDILNVVVAILLIWAGFFGNKGGSASAVASGPTPPPQNPQM